MGNRDKSSSNVIPITWIDESDRCAVISGYENSRKMQRLKELQNCKGNCYFTRGVSNKCVDFIYRAVKKLGLQDEKFLFSRGAVKKRGVSILNAVETRELDWAVGTSVKIPARLSYDRKVDLLIDNETHSVRLMELIILNCLLRKAGSRKSDTWYANMAAGILALGWGCLDNDEPPEVLAIKNN